MIVDGVTVEPGATLPADVCIVGAGPAGISLALRLSRGAGARIVVLETGGLTFEPSAQDLARGDAVGLPYYPLHETRIRMLGGSTQSWGGVCSPLDRTAMMERAWVPGSGWPFEDGALDAYLDAALGMCGIPPEYRERQAAAIDAERPEWAELSADVEPATIYFGRPIRFGTHYRQRLEDDRGITVYLHSTATELVASPGGGALDEVVVRRLDGFSFRVRARFIVLAGGGVENARILLVSRGRDPVGFGGLSEMLGRAFMEHPRVSRRFAVRPGRTPIGRLLGGRTGVSLRFHRAQLSPEVQRREELLAWHANLQFGFVGHASRAWPSVRRLAIATRIPWRESPYFQDGGGGPTRLRSADVMAVLREPVAAAFGGLGSLAAPPWLRRWLEVVGSVEQVPRPENRIELSTDLDELGVPRARVVWSVDPAEERTHRRAMTLLLEALERIEPGISRAALDPDDPWPAGIIGTWHHLGGTRMAASPAAGVVDADGRVHGLDNAYVVGGSVFPVSGSTSPTVTIVQLALRLGDHLSGRIAASVPAVTSAAVDGGGESRSPAA